ncbi:MAG: energy-coupling factor transporter ATPase [Lachnospiraceae bacterium]|nr:energy-coupling factor transporter ATPase [Lachnospiraceae bacterium]
MSIIVNHVSYSYNPDTPMESKALKDINLVINDGEFLGLIGHTGSGKSTLVQHLNGLIKPTSGEIYYNGKDISDSDFSLKKLRGDVGLVFQYPEHQLFGEDVFSDVCFGPVNKGLSKKDAELKAFAALKQVGIEDEYFYQSPFDLSGGQKRRVAIAGVLAMEPDVLVLDEPTAGLDPAGRDEILEILNNIRKERGCSIVLVSHSMEDVADHADRIVVMNKGSIIFDDVPREVFKHARELDEIGLSVPEVTKAMVRLRKEGFDVDTDVINISEAVETISKCFGI